MACTGRACVLEIISMQTFAGQVTNFFHGSQVNLSGNAQLGGAWPLIPNRGKDPALECRPLAKKNFQQDYFHIVF